MSESNAAREQAEAAARVTAASYADRKWLEDRVLIKIPAPHLGAGDDLPAINVGINGTKFVLPRGRVLNVPRAILTNLESLLINQWAMPGRFQMQGLVPLGELPRFPVYELGQAPKNGEQVLYIRPRPPLGADQRQALARAQVEVAQEDAHARVALARGAELDLPE